MCVCVHVYLCVCVFVVVYNNNYCIYLVVHEKYPGVQYLVNRSKIRSTQTLVRTHRYAHTGTHTLVRTHRYANTGTHKMIIKV